MNKKNKNVIILIFLIINLVVLFKIMTKIEKIDNFFEKNDVYKIDGIVLYDEIENFKVEK